MVFGLAVVELLVGVWLDQRVAVPFAVVSSATDGFSFSNTILMDFPPVIRRLLRIGVDAILLLLAVWLSFCCAWPILSIQASCWLAVDGACCSSDWAASVCVHGVIQKFTATSAVQRFIALQLATVFGSVAGRHWRDATSVDAARSSWIRFGCCHRFYGPGALLCAMCCSVCALRSTKSRCV